MKVLHCIHSLNPAGGGPGELVRLITRAACESNHRSETVFEVVCLDSPDCAYVEAFPGAVHALGPALGRYGFTTRLPRWLEENGRKFDVVLVHGIWQFPSFAVWRASKRDGPPYVLMPHGMLDPWFNRAYPLKHAKKFLYWKLIESRVLSEATAVVFTAEEELLQARLSFRPFDCDGQVITVGTLPPEDAPDRQRQAFLASHPDFAGKRFLLFLGRLHEKKGLELLFDAMAEIDTGDIFLAIAGEGEPRYREMLKRRIADRSPPFSDRVIWLGQLSGDGKWGALRSAEALVLPSHQENFGLVVAEALSCGTPVLISNKVNIFREIAGDGAGIVGDDDVSGTRQTLERWLALSSGERASMSDQALRCFNTRFNLNHRIGPLLKVLESAAAGREVRV